MPRAADLLLSALALAVLSPVLLAVAIAIKVRDPGPVFYVSPRLGRGGRTFGMIKFRTMRVDAPDLRNPDGSTQSHAEDPRVTPIGRWLRRTSLDELPQLINVLRGEMSLVGPRPDLPDQIRYYAPADHERLRVRPGITGLAQVSGRNGLSWEERRALDVAYVARRSFAGDLLILARTLPGVARGTGVFGTSRSRVPDERPSR